MEKIITIILLCLSFAATGYALTSNQKETSRQNTKKIKEYKVKGEQKEALKEYEKFIKKFGTYTPTITQTPSNETATATPTPTAAPTPRG